MEGLLKMKNKINAFLSDKERMYELGQNLAVGLVIAANGIVIGAIGYMAACFVLASYMN